MNIYQGPQQYIPVQLNQLYAMPEVTNPYMMESQPAPLQDLSLMSDMPDRRSDMRAQMKALVLGKAVYN